MRTIANIEDNRVGNLSQNAEEKVDPTNLKGFIAHLTKQLEELTRLV